MHHTTCKIPDAVIKTVYNELNKLIYMCDYIWCDSKHTFNLVDSDGKMEIVIFVIRYIYNLLNPIAIIFPTTFILYVI